jgi:hypothetical protein
MIKRLVHIILVLIVASAPSIAKAFCTHSPCVKNTIISLDGPQVKFDVADTAKVKKEPDDKKKIKEIAKARRQAKPEKLVLTPVDSLSNKPKVKPPRQRRPDGLVRPPEIPRRNNN